MEDVKIKIIEDIQTLNKAIMSFGAKEKENEVLIHTLACSVLYHVDKHQDVTVATNCINSFKENLSASRYKGGLIKWFEAFGKVRYDEKQKMFRLVKGKETKLEEAIKIPYWIFAPEKEVQKVNFTSAIKSVLALADRRVKAINEELDEDTKEELIEKTDINEAMYKEINDIFLKYQAKKVA